MRQGRSGPGRCCGSGSRAPRAGYRVYYGEVPELPGGWASGQTLEGCRRELKEVIEGWILVSVRRSLDLPRLGSAEIKEIDARAA